MASKILEKLWRRQKGCCKYCGRGTALRAGERDPLGATVDHVVPRAGGGANDAANRVMACRACNGAKGSMDVVAFEGVLARNGGLPPLTKAQVRSKMRREKRALRLNAMPDLGSGWKAKRLPAPAWQNDLAQYPGGRWHADGAPHGE